MNYSIREQVFIEKKHLGIVQDRKDTTGDATVTYINTNLFPKSRETTQTATSNQEVYLFQRNI